MRKVIERIKVFYDKGIYSIADIDVLFSNGKITQEEYMYIVDENVGSQQDS